MRDIYLDLAAALAWALAAVGVALLVPLEALRLALVLPFVLFLPGYSLTAALYPHRHDLSPVERLALSLGLSLAMVPLVGLALCYSPWGIRLQPLLGALCGLVALLLVAALFRRWSLGTGEAFAIRLPRLDGSLPALAAGAALLLFTGAGIAGAVYVARAWREPAEAFSEFYVLGPDGTVGAYPREVEMASSVDLILGVVNQEGQRTTYRLEGELDGEEPVQIGPFGLGEGERWQKRVKVPVGAAGSNRRVEFVLYRDGESEPYRRLHLWLDVSPPPTPSPTPIPLSPLPTPTPQPPSAVVYVVERGDCLWVIGRSFGVSVDNLAAANEIDNPDIIWPRQELVIPAGP